MTSVNVLPMGPNEYAVDVTEGDVTTAHRVVVPETLTDALTGVVSDEPTLVRESVQVFLDHKKAAALPDDFSLDWIADTVPQYFDEVRARLT